MRPLTPGRAPLISCQPRRRIDSVRGFAEQGAGGERAVGDLGGPERARWSVLRLHLGGVRRGLLGSIR